MEFYKMKLYFSEENNSDIIGYFSKDNKLFCVCAGLIGSICHWVIHEKAKGYGFLQKDKQGNLTCNLEDYSDNLVEPSYTTKLEALETLGKWKETALEIYPPKDEIVDEINAYHMWEIPSLSFFPIYKSVLRFLRWHHKPGLYKIQGHNVILTDKKHWKEKQAEKDELIGENATAVEIINKKFVKFGLTAIVETGKLIFGLSPE